MAMTIQELREKRNKAWDEARNFLDSKRTESGVLSEEDSKGASEFLFPLLFQRKICHYALSQPNSHSTAPHALRGMHGYDIRSSQNIHPAH